MTSKTCPHCQHDFSTPYLDKVYCSRSCQKKAYKSRLRLHPEWVAKEKERSHKRDRTRSPEQREKHILQERERRKKNALRRLIDPVFDAVFRVKQKEHSQRYAGKSKCKKCGAEMRKRRINSDLCVSCFPPVKKSDYRCEKCGAKMRKRRVDSNLCTSCFPNPNFLESIKNTLHRRRERQKSDNPLTSQQWRDIQASYSHKCAYCGNGGKMTIEHVIPLAKGGTHTAENVVPACLDCNRKKNRLPLLQFMYKMLQA